MRSLFPWSPSIEITERRSPTPRRITKWVSSIKAGGTLSYHSGKLSGSSTNCTSTAHRPLIDRSSTARRPLVNTTSTALLEYWERAYRPNLRFFDLEMRSMWFLLAVDERSMSGRWAVDGFSHMFSHLLRLPFVWRIGSIRFCMKDFPPTFLPDTASTFTFALLLILARKSGLPIWSGRNRNVSNTMISSSAARIWM